MYNFPPPYSNFYKKSVNKSNSSKNKIISKKNNYTNHEEVKDNTNSDIDFINIFGIKLYSDDIIILFIIFILYKDNITDTSLIICLLLLLLN